MGWWAWRVSFRGLLSVRGAPTETNDLGQGRTRLERWTNQWKELYEEVITSGLCTGCAGCVIACPHDVIGYKHEAGRLQAVPPRGGARPDDCIHGQKGCTSCTRACPRFRAWEPQADEHLFARVRQPDEPAGIYQDILLTRASDDMVHQMGQDGGLVSAILIWALEQGYIDAALTSYLEAGPTTPGWKAIPGRGHHQGRGARRRRQPLHVLGQHAGHDEAIERGFSKLALVGMSCQSSVPPVMWSRKVGKVGKPFVFNIGLLCSKTSTTRSSRSCSGPSTAWPSRTWSR
jgi:coenzyme F420 hydrogenase subunit beta